MSDETRKGRLKSTFNEHGILLYLDRELYVAFVRLMADKELGRSYAGLLGLVTGFYHLGYISKEVYDKHAAKYTERLQPSEIVTPEVQKEKDLLIAKDKQFNGQIEQWEQHSSPEWRAKVLADAKKYETKLDSAKQLLRLGNKEQFCGIIPPENEVK